VFVYVFVFVCLFVCVCVFICGCGCQEFKASEAREVALEEKSRRKLLNRMKKAESESEVGPCRDRVGEKKSFRKLTLISC